MGRSFYGIILIVAALVQGVAAMIAEYNEEYTKAIYEMMWLFVFVYLVHQEIKDES